MNRAEAAFHLAPTLRLEGLVQIDVNQPSCRLFLVLFAFETNRQCGPFCSSYFLLGMQVFVGRDID